MNAFYVFAEFALVAVDRTKVERHAEEGDRRAGSVLRALRTLSFQLSGVQLGITITSLVVGFLAESVIARPLEGVLANLPFMPEGSLLPISVALALALATAVQMVVGELVPKSFAIAKPLPTARAVATPLRASNTLLRPLILFLNSAANLTVRLLRIEPSEELVGMRSLDEIELLIRMSAQEGALRREEASLLTRSITFGDKTAFDALVPRTAVVALSENATATHLTSTALESGHSRFPTYRTSIDEITGVVHVKDSYRIPPEARAETTISELNQQPLIVPDSRRLADVLLDMQRERKHMAVVVDEFGATAGILTVEDLLEEIVGEIEDEHDQARGKEPTTAVPEGIYVVSGIVHPDEVFEQTGFEMPESRAYDTLAGFLLTLFDRIPDAGDHTSYAGWEFKIMEMDRRRIASVLMVAPPGERR